MATESVVQAPVQEQTRKPSRAATLTIRICQLVIAGVLVYSASVLLDRHEQPTQPPASVDAPRPGGTVSTPMGTLDVPPAGQLPSDVPFGSRPPQPAGTNTRPEPSGTGQAPGRPR